MKEHAISLNNAVVSESISTSPQSLSTWSTIVAVGVKQGCEISGCEVSGGEKDKNTARLERSSHGTYLSAPAP